MLLELHDLSILDPTPLHFSQRVELYPDSTYCQIASLSVSNSSRYTTTAPPGPDLVHSFEPAKTAGGLRMDAVAK